MHAKRYYEARFRQALQQLNKAQRRAVAHTEGPVLVIAGPGTGKTHVLSARIGRILLDTDTRADEILCLTFTDAAVRAMRHRLVELIGPEGYRVQIYTFHSFCNSIIQRHAELFSGYDLEPVSEIEQVEIVHALLAQLPPDHPLRHGRNLRHSVDQLRTFFQWMKAEHWSVAYVQQRLDEWLALLPTLPRFHYKRSSKKHNYRAGDLKKAEIARERQRIELLRQAAQLFPQYQKAMQARGRYDYHDMILWVIDAFRQNEWLLRDYQEQFQYILVDEYQDTNSAQNELVRLLADYWDVPNLFIVGDDDQSIYEFQGARLENLVELYHRYQPQIEVVVLTDNYRSSPPILQLAQQLIAHNELRLIHKLQHLSVDKVLNAAGPAAATSVSPRLVETEDPLREAIFSFQLIKQWLEEGCPAEQIAVIYARHQQADLLTELLRHSHIPFEAKRPINALDDRSVRALCLMLEWVWRVQREPDSAEALLFELLHLPCWQIPPQDLHQLARYRSTHYPTISWYQLLQPEQLSAVPALSQPQALRHAAEVLRQAERQASLMSLPHLIEQLVNQSGLLAWVLSPQAEPGQRDALWSLLAFVREEVQRRPRMHLEEFLLLLQRMDAHHLSLPVQQPAATRQAITLVTAHSAKGLEFDRVIILGCQRQMWEEERTRNHSTLYLPDTLTRSVEADFEEARRRLFYVALTRARTHLVCTWALTDTRGKEVQPTRFLQEMQPEPPWPIERPSFELVALRQLQERLMEPTTAPTIPQPDEAWLRQQLQGYVLSISALNQLLKCPLGFYYRFVLQVPVMPSAEARWGLAMHEALRRFFEQRRLHAESWPPTQALVSLFQQEMAKQRGWFTPDQWQLYLEQGSHYLSEWWDRQTHRPNHYLIERHIQGTLGQVPISGVIDRIDLSEPHQAHVIDYKLRAHKYARIHPPSPTNEYGSTFWRQLAFYQLLLEQDQQLGCHVVGTHLLFLTPNDQGHYAHYTHIFNEEELQQMRQLVETVYSRIQAFDFFTGCGQLNCPWCHRARSMERASLRDVELEELM